MLTRYVKQRRGTECGAGGFQLFIRLVKQDLPEKRHWFETGEGSSPVCLGEDHSNEKKQHLQRCWGGGRSWHIWEQWLDLCSKAEVEGDGVWEAARSRSCGHVGPCEPLQGRGLLISVMWETDGGFWAEGWRYDLPVGLTRPFCLLSWEKSVGARGEAERSLKDYCNSPSWRSQWLGTQS